MLNFLSFTLIFYLLNFAVSSQLNCSMSDSEIFFNKSLRNVCVIIGTKEDSIDEDPIVGENSNAEGFKIANYAIAKFPQHLNPEIVAIEIFNCSLPQINMRDLKIFTNLTFLSLESNKISVIPPMLFIYNGKLERISFKDNPIIHIDPLVFFKAKENLIEMSVEGIECLKDENNLSEIFKVIEAKNCTVDDWKFIGEGYTNLVKAFGNQKDDLEDCESNLKTAEERNEQQQKEFEAERASFEEKECPSTDEGSTTSSHPEDDFRQQFDEMKILKEELESELQKSEKKLNETKSELEGKVKKFQEESESEMTTILVMKVIIAMLIVSLIIFVIYHFRVVRERSSYEPKTEESYSITMKQLNDEQN